MEAYDNNGITDSASAAVTANNTATEQNITVTASSC